MKLRRRFSGEMGINSRLLAWFLAIALIPCGLIGLVGEFISSRAMEETVQRGLMVVSENKAAAIDSFIRERRGDVTLAGHLPFVVKATQELGEFLSNGSLDSADYKSKSASYRKLFAQYRDAYGYETAFLFDVDGKLLFQSDPLLEVGTNIKTGPLKSSELSELLDRANMLLQSVIADYQIYPGIREPISFIAAPIFNTEGVKIGVIALQFGNKEIYRILNDFNGLGETGEVVVGKSNGDEVTIVAPTRFEPSAAFKHRVRLGSAELPAMQKATRGERGSGEMLDYQGQRTMSVWSYVPSLRWGLVVKQNVSEAYSMIYRQRMITMAVTSLTLLIVTLVAQQVARSLSRPLVAAVEMAQKVASGDLSEQTIKVKAKGEVGKLLRGIGAMTLDLRSLIGKIQKSSVSLMSAATQIAATSKQQEQSVHEYGTSTNEAAAAVKEISATGQALFRTMTEVNTVVGQTAEMASQGQQSLLGMDKTMHQLADSTASIGSKLSVISERAANINLVVTTITKVADQTNLLSINAAIEAEKAGEYGLGFLVVAREIRRLADTTAVSTLDIERMVKEMQYSVSAGVMEMDKFSDQVRQGVREVANISSQLSNIIMAVHGLTDRFEQVTEGMRVQAQGADQIREAVVHLSDGVNQTLVSLREFNQATYQLREAVGGLKEEVSRFRIESATA